MAARAKIRFSTSGTRSVTGAFGKIGSSAGKAGTGIGAAFSKIMFSVGRISMLTAGLQKMGKSAMGAKKDIKGFGYGSVIALSATSKKFAELRRKYHFLKMAGEKIAEPFIWAMGGGAKPKVKTRKRKKAAAITPEAVAPTQAAQAAQASQKWIDNMAATTAPAIMSARMYKKVAMAQAAAAVTATAAAAATVAASTKVASSAANVVVATTAWQKFLGVLSGGAGKKGGILSKIFSLTNVIKTLGIALGLVSVAGGIAFVVLGYKTAKFAKNMIVDFMNIREAFRQYEISIGGVIRNTYAVGKMMQFAVKYASEYPAMFEEVLDTFRSLSALPALKPMFRRADEQDLKGIMDVIQGLATLDPIQGVKGAGIALREALSGDMRSIRRRFEISARSIAEAGGYTLAEITQNSEKALKAFRAFIELNVPAKSMADAAMTIGIQFGNLRDKYRGFTNEIMKSTGAYWSVVTALSGLNDWLQKVFASPIIKGWAMAAGDHIRAFVKTIESVLSKVNWAKYIKEGKLAEGFMEAAQRVSAVMESIAEMWGKPFVAVVAKIAGILWKGLKPVFWEVIKSIGGLFKEGFLITGKLAATALLEGLSSGNIFKSIGGLFATLGQLAVDSFIAAFAGGMMLLGPLFNWISEKTGEMAKTIDEKFPGGEGNIWHAVSEKMGVAGDFWTKEGKEAVEDFMEGLQKVRSREVVDSMKKMAIDSENAYINTLKKREAEVVTPELTIKQHKWIVEDLQKKLAANIKLNDSDLKRKAILESLAKAEAALAMAGRREEFAADPKGGILLKATTKQIGEIKTQFADAYKAGRNLSAPIYDLLNILENLETKLQGVSDKFVEQLDPVKDLAALIHSTADTMKEWGEEYEISKKGAGGLLLIVKKLNDILTQKIEAPDKEGMESLLQERIKLTDEVTEKEKEYRKEIKKTTESTAERFIKLSTDLSSSITSFFDKYGKYLRKFSSYAGIGGQTMVPENLFGMGRSGMTYGRGAQRAQGTKTPNYINYMLQGIKEAMQGFGIGKTPEGQLALSNLKLDLLGKKFETARRGEKPDILADLAGTQADNMKRTVDKATADAQVQIDIRTATQETSQNTKAALEASKKIEAAIANIRISAPSATTAGTSPQTGNSKISGSNPGITPFPLGTFAY